MSALVLASASPRRKEILSTLGLQFDVRVSQVHEERAPGERAADYVRRLSQEKAASVAALLAAQGTHACVIGADTVVVLDERVLEKPRDAAHAKEMIYALGGRSHDVLTGVTVHAADGQVLSEIVSTRVTFHPISDAAAAAYARSGEGLDKAGAYAVQGLGSGFVARIEGSYTNVVGLPAAEVVQLLLRARAIRAWP